ILQYLGKPVTVVGTTSLRTIESVYWLGVKVTQQPNLPLEELVVHQWDPYETTAPPSAQTALQNLLQYLKHRGLDRIITKTSLLIAPGYSFQIPTALVTNFHQPQSTLLLLVAAFTGNTNWRTIYQHALDNDFRFLSYGDGCLLFRPE